MQTSFSTERFEISEVVKTVLNDVKRLMEKHGKLIVVDIGFKPHIICADYDFTEFVLSSQSFLNKSGDYLYLTNWLGTGLLTSDGSKWKKRRRLTTPAFHFSILESFIPSFEKNSDILLQKLDNLVGQEIDIYRYVTLFALDVIAETAMAVELRAQDFEDSDYVQHVKTMCRIIQDRPLSIFKSNDLFYPLFPDYYIERRAVKYLHNVTYNVIDSRMAAQKDTHGFREEYDELGKKKRMPFLDILLQSEIDGKSLSRDDIREEVDTFMFEGHDTTASAISFALFLLSNHQDVQERALEEQKLIFEDDLHQTISFEDLHEMKYLECVIKETLRLYPSVAAYARRTTNEIIYKGHVIPRGINIAIFAYGILRDPEFYENPDNFDPGRFELNDGKKPYAYIPFSAGPRNCIGQKFAILEMKVILSKVLRRFQLLPTSPLHQIILSAEAVLKSKNGIKLKLVMRK
ncbi:unnamed protein product [Acanthoscelides obtectus]|uniref:Cytochrome P450 n=1 Tax=Acanthoscelides obtectus TaxID=200917 RepID=A0A9P0K720_ACAOB|nr:unnamed protein product [Acanthoscelides obtectus]CAK1669961.1 Cytochrome P450 4c3 [Acanthoscelides obtectus]